MTLEQLSFEELKFGARIYYQLWRGSEAWRTEGNPKLYAEEKSKDDALMAKAEAFAKEIINRLDLTVSTGVILNSL